jgi:archaellum biogenesis protein FlaJ (TadC family)
MFYLGSLQVTEILSSVNKDFNLSTLDLSHISSVIMEYESLPKSLLKLSTCCLLINTTTTKSLIPNKLG